MSKASLVAWLHVGAGLGKQLASIAAGARIQARVDTLLEHVTAIACVSRERHEPISCPCSVDVARAVAAK
jgi:hypothetical protein